MWKLWIALSVATLAASYWTHPKAVPAVPVDPPTQGFLLAGMNAEAPGQELPNPKRKLERWDDTSSTWKVLDSAALAALPMERYYGQWRATVPADRQTMFDIKLNPGDTFTKVSMDGQIKLSKSHSFTSPPDGKWPIDSFEENKGNAEMCNRYLFPKSRSGNWTYSSVALVRAAGTQEYDWHDLSDRYDPSHFKIESLSPGLIFTINHLKGVQPRANGGYTIVFIISQEGRR